MKNRKLNIIKVIGAMASALLFSATMLVDWAKQKEQEALIDELLDKKLNEALAERDEENEEES